jgi:hypothetical protein
VPFYADALGYAAESAPAPAVRSAPRPKIIDAASLSPKGALDVERVTERVVRLTRRGDDRSVLEVVLFVADSGSSVIAAQTVREPPYTALFDVTRRVAFVGLTIVYPDGVRSTLLVPYRE